MFDIYNILMFAGASIILILAPGPDIIFTITQGISNGKKAGMITALGLSLGNSVHTTAAALGISIIFRTSDIAFTVFKVMGAAYLFYLAYKSIKHRNDIFSTEKKDVKKATPIQLFFKGFLMNVLNPKVALFFLAFLPQFVDQKSGNIPMQIFTLGSIFIVLVIIIFGMFGYFAGLAGERLIKNKTFSKSLGTLSAAIFIGLGVKLALAQR